MGNFCHFQKNCAKQTITRMGKNAPNLVTLEAGKASMCKSRPLHTWRHTASKMRNFSESIKSFAEKTAGDEF
jgi:hypothetical protein